LAAAIIGFLGGRMWPEFFSTAGGHAASQTNFGTALINDDTPTPSHAMFSLKRLLQVLMAGLMLWAVPMGYLVIQNGWDHTFTQMSWFFTKAALLTFGGAYAVLPYVFQGAVEQFGWVTATQMMDGLALGETTPGPLIMVVAFVGFVGGYVKAVLGPDSLFLAGTLAAMLVTWFTFLPSFIFILAGGPFVESTHNNLKFTAPLTAITAAVVGVIVNLALFFGYHTLWPQGFGGSLDLPSALIAVAAAVALFKFKRNVMQVIGVCGLLGICLQYGLK
jgi:chromate transporter